MSKQYFFITGSSQGIGKALAERALQEDSAVVYGISRTQTIEHARYRHISFDLSDTEALIQDKSHFFPELQDAARIVLINNAGSLGDVKYVGQLQEEIIASLFNVNVTAPAVLMNRFMATYQTYDAEKLIINVSSGAGKYPVDGWSGYCASKAALDMLTQTAALEQQKSGSTSPFKLYAVAPGVVDTAMQENIRQVDRQSFSTLDKFLNLKKEGQLDDAQKTAEKFFHLINHAQDFPDVLQDVRKF